MTEYKPQFVSPGNRDHWLRAKFDLKYALAERRHDDLMDTMVYAHALQRLKEAPKMGLPGIAITSETTFEELEGMLEQLKKWEGSFIATHMPHAIFDTVDSIEELRRKVMARLNALLLSDSNTVDVTDHVKSVFGEGIVERAYVEYSTSWGSPYFLYKHVTGGNYIGLSDESIIVELTNGNVIDLYGEISLRRRKSLTE